VPGLPEEISVAVDLAGCPNRCRHCYLGHGPNGQLSPDVLREVAEAFWGWMREGDTEPYFKQVDVSWWYREPDFADDYRELYELQRELSRREPRRYELLSVWRLARDKSYATWAKEHGPKRCQITFFGMEKRTDEFTGRRGAFRDNLIATERLLAVDMIPRWQVFLTKPGLANLDDLMRLMDRLRLRERVADLGEEFVVFAHPPAPQGAGRDLEDVLIEPADLGRIPEDLIQATRRHFSGVIEWEPESAIVQRVLRGDRIPAYSPPEVWFFVNADLDVFPNWGEVAPWWRLGNFRQDGLSPILDVFEKDGNAGLWASYHVDDGWLARQFGRPESRKLYCPCDLKGRWVAQYGQMQQRT